MNMQPSFNGAVALTHWGVIRARGADAVKFLQGQLTNDVASLGTARARLAGFCSAKGRLQASFVVWMAGPDEVLLACSASVLQATLKRLSMFVLRAQCKLTDATAEASMWGLVGDAARPLLGDAAVWDKLADAHGTTVIRLPDANAQPRCLRLGMPATNAVEISLDTWRWLEVQSGVPTIEAPTSDKFVPQMLNYELLGGVDFQKGCYPGQEIVARSQYRGTIKRRMFLFDVDGEAMPGQEIFHSSDSAQPAGMVVNAALLPGVANSSSSGSSSPANTSHATSALVEVKLAALGDGTLHLGVVDGAVLRRRSLPYEVPSDAPQAA